MGESTYFYRRQSLPSPKHTAHSTNAYGSHENNDYNSQPVAAGLILTVESLDREEFTPGDLTQYSNGNFSVDASEST